jgi:hypothetical protein
MSATRLSDTPLTVSPGEKKRDVSGVIAGPDTFGALRSALGILARAIGVHRAALVR